MLRFILVLFVPVMAEVAALVNGVDDSEIDFHFSLRILTLK